MLLYQKQKVQKLKNRTAVLCWLQLVISIVAIIGCIYCCAVTTTRTDRLMLTITVTLSTVSGWAVILIRSLFYRPLDALWKHMESIIDCDEETVFAEGRIQKTGTVIRIPNSIAIEKVMIIRDGEDDLTVNIMASNSKFLRTDENKYVCKLVRNYIVEVNDAKKD